jgi:hypothetical protein
MGQLLPFRNSSTQSVDIHDGLRECLGSFLRQIVTDSTRDQPVRIFAREFIAEGTFVRRMWRTVGIALKRNGGYSDDGTRGKSLFQIVIFRFALSQAEPKAVIVNNDAYVIWVVEGRSGAIEGRVIKIPFW